MFSSVPQWVRVSAVVLGIGVGSEVLYELYLGWKSYCERRRARRRSALQITEVYFANERSIRPGSPGTTMARFTTEHVLRIVSLMDRARVSISLCMYILTVDSIGDALLRAAKRGVRVRVVGCSSMAYSSGSQMTRLVEGGIPVRFNGMSSTALMHHKFCLIDCDWLCARCYHAEKVRRNGFCCGAEIGGAAKKSNQEQMVAVATDGGVATSNGGSPVANGGKVQCKVADDGVDAEGGCVRCDRQQKRAVEKCKLQGAAYEPLPLGGLVLNGSTNWTMQALASNWDNMMLTSLPEIVVPYQLEFQRLWRDFGVLPSLIK